MGEIRCYSLQMLNVITEDMLEFCTVLAVADALDMSSPRNVPVLADTVCENENMN
jgi:hypothetical protein